MNYIKGYKMFENSNLNNYFMNNEMYINLDISIYYKLHDDIHKNNDEKIHLNITDSEKNRILSIINILIEESNFNLSIEKTLFGSLYNTTSKINYEYYFELLGLEYTLVISICKLEDNYWLIYADMVTIFGENGEPLESEYMGYFLSDGLDGLEKCLMNDVMKNI